MKKKLFVHIIESPGAEDFLEDRQEGHALRSMLALIGTAAKVYTVVNKDMFTEAVKRIAEFHADPANEHYHPTLHLSCHGDAQGIGLTDNGGLLSWRDLAAIIEPLSTAAAGNLLVAMSTCFGYEGLAMARTDQLPPYAILVGPKTAVEWRASAVAFCTYYLQLTKLLDEPTPADGTFLKVIANMNAAADLSDIFAFAESRYVQDEWQTKKRVVAEFKRRLAAEMAQERQERMRELARQILRQQEQQK